MAFCAALALSALPAMAGPGQGGGHHRHGADASYGAPGDPREAKRTVTVTMSDDMRFAPAGVAVRRGETVRFVVRNAGRLKHEMMLGSEEELVEHAKAMQEHPDMEHDDENAVTVPPGETRELVWRFTRAGRVDFGCLVPGHYEAGMKGHVRVSP